MSRLHVACVCDLCGARVFSGACTSCRSTLLESFLLELQATVVVQDGSADAIVVAVGEQAASLLSLSTDHLSDLVRLSAQATAPLEVRASAASEPLAESILGPICRAVSTRYDRPPLIAVARLDGSGTQFAVCHGEIALSIY